MKFDDVLRDIGEFGWYQKRVYFLAVLPCVFIGFETFSAVFIFFIPHHRCSIPGYHGDSYIAHNDSHALNIKRNIPLAGGRWDHCHVISDGLGHDFVIPEHTSFQNNVSAERAVPVDYVIHGNQSEIGSFVIADSHSKCQEWVYDDTILEATIATEMDLVCDRSWHRAISNMISEIGTLIGVLVTGFIADRFGRKIPFYIGGFALVGGGFGIYFAPSILVVNVCRFVLGVARMTLLVNGLVIGMELVGPSRRVFTGLFVQIMWSAGEFLLLGAAYFLRDWRKLEIANACASLVILTFWWLIPESPRWLASRGREDEAVNVLLRIAKSNKRQMPKIDTTKKLLDAEFSVSFRQNFRSRELVMRLLIVFSNIFLEIGVEMNEDDGPASRPRHADHMT